MALLTHPKISIVTVCYNTQETIEATVKSVLEQTYPNIEYIIIDGGSKDGTLAILAKYKNRLGYFVSEKDNGIYDAMNKALNAATGDWLYFLGGDDIMANPNIISTLVKQFQDSETVYYGDVLFKSTQLLYQFKLTNWHLCYRNISHQSVFYPKACYKRFSYNLLYKVFADHIYNIELFASKLFRFEYIRETVALYNDAGTSSNTYDKMYYKNLPSVVNKNLGFKYAIYVQIRIILFKFKKFIRRIEI